jgi:hypothetical protein
MDEINKEFKELTNVRIRTDICIDNENKRVLLNSLSESKKSYEKRLEITDAPGVIESLQYYVKKFDDLYTDIEKIDDCK